MSIDEDNNFRRALKTAAAGYSLQAFSEHQITQLVKHYSLLRRWNRRMNLTRIIDPEEAARLHYAESLSGARFIGEAASLLDVGSGAGFPVVPLAVARPDVRVAALEANQKKSLFLREVKDDLHLDNFSVANARLESFDWSGYDLLTSRALDRAETILPAVIEHLAASQRMMLFCSAELVKAIEASLSSQLSVETHSLPYSESRLIAIFSS